MGEAQRGRHKSESERGRGERMEWIAPPRRLVSVVYPVWMEPFVGTGERQQNRRNYQNNSRKWVLRTALIRVAPRLLLREAWTQENTRGVGGPIPQPPQSKQAHKINPISRYVAARKNFEVKCVAFSVQQHRKWHLEVNGRFAEQNVYEGHYATSNLQPDHHAWKAKSPITVCRFF